MGSTPWYTHVHVNQGFPKPSTDTAPTAVFLALFVLGAIGNFSLFIRNKKRGKLFVFNGLCGGFCMARLVTCALRLAFIYHVHDQGIALAATIFVAAGVLLLFLVNLIFAQRMLRGLHPHIGWQPWVHFAFLGLYALIPVLLVMVITASISLFMATDPKVIKIDIDIQRAAASYFLLVSFLPIPIVLFSLLKPNTKSKVDHFGTGSFRLKAAPLLVAATLLTLGAGFRAGTSYAGWKQEYNTPGSAPWWNAKWCFYFFNFGIEITVIAIYLASRKDKLFWIPNKAHGPGSYSGRTEEVQEGDKTSVDREALSSSDQVNVEKRTEKQ